MWSLVCSECGSLVVDLLHPCYAHFVIGYFLTPAHLGIHDVWLLLSSPWPPTHSELAQICSQHLSSTSDLIRWWQPYQDIKRCLEFLWDADLSVVLMRNTFGHGCYAKLCNYLQMTGDAHPCLMG